jgi:hypothetical protein
MIMIIKQHLMKIEKFFMEEQIKKNLNYVIYIVQNVWNLELKFLIKNAKLF